MEEEHQEVQYSIQGMDCADCALSLERSLAQIKGVETFVHLIDRSQGTTRPSITAVGRTVEAIT